MSEGSGDIIFSIIVPSRNRPAQLGRCIEALDALDYPKHAYEIIVVDDGSDPPYQPPTCAATCRLIAIDHAGPAQARNAAIAEARGHSIAFTDDDCRPDPGWLSALQRCLVTHPDHLIGGRTVNELTGNPYAGMSQRIQDIVYAHYNAVHDDARFLASNNMAVSTERLRAAGGFATAFRAAEDRELCDRWRHEGGRLAYVEDAVVRHAHPLTLRSFCRQHFQYGRGAHQYHRVRAERESGRMREEMSFHRRLTSWLIEPISEVPLGQKMRRACLLFLWQSSNTAGYFYEALRRS